MILSARALTSVASANIFTVEDTVQFTEGDGPTIYIQLVDSSVDRYTEGFTPPGRRYCPDPNATLTVSVDAVGKCGKMSRSATLAFKDRDTSIWRIRIYPTDKIVGLVDLNLELTEGGRVTRGVAKGILRVEPLRTAY